MYLTVDVGGTKTLIANFDSNFKLINQFKFPTPSNYSDFLNELKKAIESLGDFKYEYAAIATPGTINHQNYILEYGGGNVKWANVNPKQDLSNLLNCSVLFENDAKLAGLSEAILAKNEFNRVLYLTISTGIGGSLIVDQKIDKTTINSEVGKIYLNNDGKYMHWEEFASGKSIVINYGKLAKDIDDNRVWYEIAEKISLGIIAIIPILIPEVIIIGGSIGTYFNRYEDYLKQSIAKFSDEILDKSVIMQAKNPEEAVIYGCLELIKQNI